MMSTFDPIQLAGEIEKAETMLSQVGPLIATYYEALIAAGLPDELAHELTVHWHDILWQNALNWRNIQ